MTVETTNSVRRRVETILGSDMTGCPLPVYQMHHPEVARVEHAHALRLPLVVPARPGSRPFEYWLLLVGAVGGDMTTTDKRSANVLKERTAAPGVRVLVRDLPKSRHTEYTR